jgi:pyrimidine-nucleoside phosphorylase
MDPTTFRILESKRYDKRLSADDIRTVVEGAATGAWGDAELGAFLMAAAIRGLDEDETRELTVAMLESGDLWRLADDFPNLCDKHSTGGVGDKVSLVIGPLMAACGRPIVMLTGRGLGHTGGTADKLEAIPGLRMALDRDLCCRALELSGLAIGMATEQIAPADRRLYALRDRTGTVASLPLITASILSKKLASGAASIVFDVKTGDGAFLPEPDRAAKLARMLVTTSETLGLKASALLTDMSQPLGRWVGHTAEIKETLECLEGRGPEDLMEVVLSLAEELSGLKGERLERSTFEEAISTGAAREIFDRWAAIQGADPEWLHQPQCELAPHEVVILADRPGHLAQITTRRLGELLASAGGGRLTAGAKIDLGVSLHVCRSLGDEVAEGEELARAYLRRSDATLEKDLRACFTVADRAAPAPLLRGRVQSPALNELSPEEPFWF